MCTLKGKCMDVRVYRPAVNVHMASLRTWFMLLSFRLIRYDGVGCVLVESEFGRRMFDVLRSSCD